MYENTGNYGFGFLSDIENPPISLFAVGIEKRDSGEYYLDNRKRDNSYLFQYTLGGSGTVDTGGEVHTIKKGQAFFLKLPGEEKYYFDEAKNDAPWHFIYIIFNGEGVYEYYNLIKNKFGNILTVNENDP